MLRYVAMQSTWRLRSESLPSECSPALTSRPGGLSWCYWYFSEKFGVYIVNMVHKKSNKGGPDEHGTNVHFIWDRPCTTNGTAL